MKPTLFILLVLTLACSSPTQPSAPSPTPHKEHHNKEEGHGKKHYEHSFAGAEEWAKVFDDPARDAWQKPEEVIDALALPPNALVADLGAGTGYFAVRLAKRVPQGKVFAIDIEADMVKYMTDRASKEGLSNLVAIQSTADDPKLPEPVDLLLVVDTYHHIPGRVAYFSRLQKLLRPGGKLAIIDFTKEAPHGPPPEHRLAPEEVTQELREAGFSQAKAHSFLPNQYFLVYEVAKSQ